MTIALFTIGAMTSLGCGWNVIATKASPLHDLVWIFGGIVGAGLMVIAATLNAGCSL